MELPIDISAGAVDQILAEIEKNLHEMRALALFVSNGELSGRQREKAQARIDELKKDIDGIAQMLIPPEIPIQ